VYEDDLFVQHVLEEIDAHDSSQPLFYYWAMHNVHAPLEVQKREESEKNLEEGAERKRERERKVTFQITLVYGEGT
jgi:hypothetical protein